MGSDTRMPFCSHASNPNSCSGGCTVVQHVHMHSLQIIKNIIFLAIFKGFFGLYIISMCVITLRMLQPLKPSGQELLQPPNNLGSTLEHQLHLLCYFTMTSEYLFKWFYKSYPPYGIGGQLFTVLIA